MPCYLSRATLSNNVYSLLWDYIDQNKDQLKTELHQEFEKEFGKAKYPISIKLWPQYDNGYEIIFSYGNNYVQAAIYPDGRVGIEGRNQADEKLEKVERILNKFSKIGKHNAALKRQLLIKAEKSLNELGVKTMNMNKNVNKPIGSFAKSFKVPEHLKQEIQRKLKERNR